MTETLPALPTAELAGEYPLVQPVEQSGTQPAPTPAPHLPRTSEIPAPFEPMRPDDAEQSAEPEQSVPQTVSEQSLIFRAFRRRNDGPTPGRKYVHKDGFKPFTMRTKAEMDYLARGIKPAPKPAGSEQSDRPATSVSNRSARERLAERSTKVREYIGRVILGNEGIRERSLRAREHIGRTLLGTQRMDAIITAASKLENTPVEHKKHVAHASRSMPKVRKVAGRRNSQSAPAAEARPAIAGKKSSRRS